MNTKTALTILLQAADIVKAQAVIRLYEAAGDPEKCKYWEWQIEKINEAQGVVEKMKEQVTK